MKRLNTTSFTLPYKSKSYNNSMSKPSKRTSSNDIKRAKMEIAKKAKPNNALRCSKQLLELMNTLNEVLVAKLALGAVENGIKFLAILKLIPKWAGLSD